MGLSLRERKQINNLPHYSDGNPPSNDKTWLQKNLYLPQGGEGWGNAVTGVAGLLSTGMNAFSPAKTATSILSDAGYSTGYGSGFTYIKQNSPNHGKELAELSRQNTQNTLNTATAGATAGAAFGPIGAGAGFLAGGIIGLLGGGARKRDMLNQIRDAKLKTSAFNDYSFASGQSDYLNNDFYVNHNVSQNDQIYHAKDGKLPKYSLGKADAMVSNGEVVGHVNPQTRKVLDAYKIGKGVDFKDDIPVKLGKDTKTKSSFVLTRKEDPDIGVSPAELALSGDIYGALDLQKYMKNYLAYKQPWNGKLQGFVDGVVPNANYFFKKPGDLDIIIKSKIEDSLRKQKNAAYADYQNKLQSGYYTYNPDAGSKRSSWVIPAALSGLGVAIANSTHSTGEGDAQPTFADNDRAQQVLNIMNNRKTDTYAQQTALRDAESRARYDSRTKGTSIGSYALQAAANNINTLKQIAQVNALGQEAYNKLAGEEAQTIAQLGESKASRMQQSNQNWREMLHRAKSLKYTLDNNAKAQMLGQMQYGYKSIFDLNKWLDTMGLYNQDYALRADEMRRRYLS